MLVIEGRMPGLNDYIREERQNRYRAADMKRRWTNVVADLATQKREPKHDGRVRVFIRCYERDERRDADNVEAFVKKCSLDGLVRAGVIVDDSRKWLAGCSCDVLTDREFPRIEIQVVDAEEV